MRVLEVPFFVAPLVFLTLKGLSLGGRRTGLRRACWWEILPHVDPSSCHFEPSVGHTGPSVAGAWDGRVGGPPSAGSSRECHGPACRLVGNFGEKILVRPRSFCGFLLLLRSLECAGPRRSARMIFPCTATWGAPAPPAHRAGGRPQPAGSCPSWAPLPTPAALTPFPGLACRPPPTQNILSTAASRLPPLCGLSVQTSLPRGGASPWLPAPSRTAPPPSSWSFLGGRSPPTSWPWGPGLLTSPRYLESSSACFGARRPWHGYLDLTGGAREVSSQDRGGGTLQRALAPSSQLPHRGPGSLGVGWPCRTSPRGLPHRSQCAPPLDPQVPLVSPANPGLASVWAERTTLEEGLHPL